MQAGKYSNVHRIVYHNFLRGFKYTHNAKQVVFDSSSDEKASLLLNACLVRVSTYVYTYNLIKNTSQPIALSRSNAVLLRVAITLITETRATRRPYKYKYIHRFGDAHHACRERRDFQRSEQARAHTCPCQKGVRRYVRVVLGVAGGANKHPYRICAA